jgi:hypothetical protein
MGRRLKRRGQDRPESLRLSFILGTKISFVPDVVREWRDRNPGQRALYDIGLFRCSGVQRQQQLTGSSAPAPACDLICGGLTEVALAVGFEQIGRLLESFCAFPNLSSIEMTQSSR